MYILMHMHTYMYIYDKLINSLSFFSQSSCCLMIFFIITGNYEHRNNYICPKTTPLCTAGSYWNTYLLRSVMPRLDVTQTMREYTCTCTCHLAVIYVNCESPMDIWKCHLWIIISEIYIFKSEQLLFFSLLTNLWETNLPIIDSTKRIFPKSLP